MKNLKLAYKIFALSIALILAFSLTIGWVYSRTKSKLFEAKRADVQHVVEATWGIVDHFVKQADSGALPLAEAQQRAKDAVRNSRFQGDNYFWLSDLQLRMLMHPEKPELEGKDLSGLKDASGKPFFVELARVAKAEGQGFVEYLWPKPGATKPVGKISFSKLVPNWSWTVSAGLYVDDVEAELAGIFYLTLGAVLTVIAFSLLLVFYVARSISVPVARTVEMIEGMGRGKLDSRLNLDQSDEVGRLAKAMDAFADNLQDEILTAFQKLAEGDFTFKAQGLIREPLARANAGLNEVMAQIQLASEQIASGSDQVASTSQCLSQGATEQASSMEQISASMNQMASQTSQNAGNATQASRLAAEARASAQRGNEQMKEMVAAMAEINASGQSISKIIKVIDEIAFQTNLLALNAAVEAARAGQHGKGFAVVAEEVRNLAARSARAAQETSELIEGSVQKAQNGSQIATRTAESLTEIAQGISRVTDLVAEIAAASNEQSEGIGQVNQGLGQIDQVTQQNTANAEEGAAAAEELNGQARHLKEMLAGFRLEGQAQKGTQLQYLARKSPGTGWKQPNARPSRQQPPAQIALDDAEFGKF